MYDFERYFRIRVERVKDGDTIVASFYLGLGIWLNDQPVRLLGINAPEMKGESREQGEAVKVFLESLLKDADDVIIRTDEEKKGKYGRFLVTLLALKNGKWHNVNELLLKRGAAKEYMASAHLEYWQILRALEPFTKIRNGMTIGGPRYPKRQGGKEIWEFTSYLFPEDNWSSDKLEIEVSIQGDIAEIHVTHQEFEEDEDGSKTGYRSTAAEVKGRIDGDPAKLSTLALQAARKTKGNLRYGSVTAAEKPTEIQKEIFDTPPADLEKRIVVDEPRTEAVVYNEEDRQPLTDAQAVEELKEATREIVWAAMQKSESSRRKPTARRG